MCVKLFSRDLNPDAYSSHLTNIYTNGATIVLNVCDDQL